MPTPRSSRSCANATCSWPKRSYQHSYPYCWRSKTPIIFRAVEQFFIRIDALRDAGAGSDQAGQMAAAVGRNPHLRHRRIAAGLGDLAATQLGRAAAGLLSTRMAPPSSIADWIRKLADLVERRGSNIWFELDDAALARDLGLPAGTNTSQRHDRCLDRFGREPSGGAGAESRAPRIRPTCISKRRISIAAGFSRPS